MTKQEFEALVARGPVLLDGAMGSNLLERGCPRAPCRSCGRTGTRRRCWSCRRPMPPPGAGFLYAPTFQAQPEALAQAGWTGDVGALNARLVALTRRAAGAGYSGGGGSGHHGRMPGVLEPGEFPPDDRPIPAADWGGFWREARTFWWRRPFCTPPGGGGGAPGGGAGGGETSLSSIASPCSQTAPFFPARRRARCSGSWRRQALQPWASTAWRRAPPLPALVSKLRRYVRGPLVSKPNAGNPTVSRRAGWCIPMGPEEFARLQAEACRMGAGLLGRLLRHHPRLPVRPPGPPGGRGPPASPPDVRFPV